MEKITVVDWVDYNDEKINECPVSIGGLGGWFESGMRWNDYLESLVEGRKIYAEALRNSIIQNEIRYTGDEHQNASDGVPLFSDGTIGSFSFRAWGDLMAAIWSTEDNRNYCYMDYYM